MRGEITANVRLDDRHTCRLLDVDALGNSSNSIQVARDRVFVRQATLAFALQPSFLEITSNAELPHNALDMTIQATLVACYETSFCSATHQSLFSLEARLHANYFGTEFLDIDVSGAARLDLRALRTPAINDTGNAAVGWTRRTSAP